MHDVEEFCNDLKCKQYDEKPQCSDKMSRQSTAKPTVATPRKNVGRVFPSIWWPKPLTSTKVPFWSATSSTIPDGYISFTDGRNTTAREFKLALLASVSMSAPKVDDGPEASEDEVLSENSARTWRRRSISCSNVLGYVP